MTLIAATGVYFLALSIAVVIYTPAK